MENQIIIVTLTVEELAIIAGWYEVSAENSCYEVYDLAQLRTMQNVLDKLRIDPTEADKRIFKSRADVEAEGRCQNLPSCQRKAGHEGSCNTTTGDY